MWMVVDVHCWYCGHHYVAVVEAGTVGRECSYCGVYDEAYQWPAIEPPQAQSVPLVMSA